MLKSFSLQFVLSLSVSLKYQIEKWPHEMFLLTFDLIQTLK